MLSSNNLQHDTISAWNPGRNEHLQGSVRSAERPRTQSLMRCSRDQGFSRGDGNQFGLTWLSRFGLRVCQSMCLKLVKIKGRGCGRTITHTLHVWDIFHTLTPKQATPGPMYIIDKYGIHGTFGLGRCIVYETEAFSDHRGTPSSWRLNTQFLETAISYRPYPYPIDVLSGIHRVIFPSLTASS